VLSRPGDQARYADQQQDQPSLGGVCCNWASSMISIGALGWPATAVTAPITRACGRFDSGTTQMHSICQAKTMGGMPAGMGQNVEKDGRLGNMLWKSLQD
jgi:hypothetical protein